MQKFIIILLIVLATFIVSGCTETQDDALTIHAVQVDQETISVEYFIDDLDLSSIQFIVFYSDGSRGRENMTVELLESGEADKLNEPGTHSLRFNYQGHRSQFEITLLEAGSRIIDFYYLNDLHGALLQDGNQMGMANIGNLLNDAREARPESTVILAGGDMLQGGFISNASYGEITVELMDLVGFDAAVIGNHEFDWGLEMVTRYYTDMDEDVYRAQHPFLGANVVYKGTTSMPEGIDPYTVLDKGNLRIGVIGVIGYGLESSISRLMVEDYEFLDPVPIIGDYAEYLRQEEAVDLVVVVAHGSSNFLNGRVANLTADARVDILFNGHSHRVETETYGDMLSMQSGGYGSHLGHIRVTVSDGVITNYSMRNLTASDDTRLRRADSDVETFLEYALEDLSHFFETLFVAEREITREELAQWMASLMLEVAGAEYAFQNMGGTRHSISAGESISLSTLLNIFPFDNQVVSAYVSGEALGSFIEHNVTITRLPHTPIDPDALYFMATTDFLFFREGNNQEDNATVELVAQNMQDLIIDELLLQAEVYDTFDTNNPLLLPNGISESSDTQDEIHD